MKLEEVMIRSDAMLAAFTIATSREDNPYDVRTHGLLRDDCRKPIRPVHARDSALNRRLIRRLTARVPRSRFVRKP